MRWREVQSGGIGCEECRDIQKVHGNRCMVQVLG